MTDDTALKILQALLAERGISVPVRSGDAATDMRRLLQDVLAIGMSDVPAELERALAETFDTVSASSEDAESKH